MYCASFCALSLLLSLLVVVEYIYILKKAVLKNLVRYRGLLRESSLRLTGNGSGSHMYIYVYTYIYSVCVYRCIGV